MFAAEGGAAMKKQARGFAAGAGWDERFRRASGALEYGHTEYTQRDEQGD